MHKENYSEVY